MLPLSSGPAVQSVQLVPFLRAHYSAPFLANIGMVKIDAEEHDTFILQDLMQHADFRPPVIWTEWSSRFKIDRDTMVFEVNNKSRLSHFSNRRCSIIFYFFRLKTTAHQSR